MKTIAEKCLELNLDSTVYGTFAEIGAGQEVANQFFRASASAGTVAKTISAYDMTMSDEIYGKCNRYVSRSRLHAMMDYEYDILCEHLSEERGGDTTFFSFSNTVKARGYKDTSECHGWMGVKFQLRPGDKPVSIIIHIRLLDEENTDQMAAIGKLGVNLIYGAFRYRNRLDLFVTSLLDGLSSKNVEIDMLKYEGVGFQFVDNRLCALELVKQGLTSAAMFLPSGEVVPPAEVLYGKSILLLRGSFRPVLNLHLDMIRQARQTFYKYTNASEENKDNTIELCEVTLNNLLRGNDEVDLIHFIDCVDVLQSLGKTVLISNCPEFHRITTLLSCYTKHSIGVILSIGLLNELFKEKWSENLSGGILESFGRLFKHDVRLLVYPWMNRKTQDVVTADNFLSPSKYQHLYRHLNENEMILPVGIGDQSLMQYTSRDVTNALENKEGLDWSLILPEEVRGKLKI